MTSTACQHVRQLQTRLLLGVLGITLVVFAGVCPYGFVHFDDNVTIYNNPHIRGLSWENLHWMFANASYARRYMPLGWLSYAVDYQLFGLNPHVYHAGNLLLHLVNVALLFCLLKRLVLLAQDPATPQIQGTGPVWCAAVGALFWAVNPLRVENVAWASARIYCVAFCLAALWLLAWLRAQDAETSKGRRRIFYWLSVVFFAASLLTYPLAMFAPIALFALEVYPLRRAGFRFRDWWGRSAWHIWLDKLPFFVVAAGMLGLTFFALLHTDARYAPLTLKEFPPLARAMQAFYVWAYYLWKPWAPYDLAISYMTLHSFNPLAWQFVVSAALVLSLTVALFLCRKRWPGLFVLWVCHLVMLVPVLGLSEYPHSAYDRYSYLPGVLWSVALAFGLHRIWKRERLGQLGAILAASTSALFGLVAWGQVSVWQDTIPLYENLIAHVGNHPDRARFDTVLGIHYLQAGLTNEAIASFKSAIHYEPLRPDRRFFDEGVLRAANTHLGAVFAEQGRLEEAFECYRAAAQANPSHGWAAAQAGAVLVQLDRNEEAVKWLTEALRLRTETPEIHHSLAVALRKLGREQEAAEHAEAEQRMLKARPANPGP